MTSQRYYRKQSTVTDVQSPMPSINVSSSSPYSGGRASASSHDSESSESQYSPMRSSVVSLAPSLSPSILSLDEDDVVIDEATPVLIVKGNDLQHVDCDNPAKCTSKRWSDGTIRPAAGTLTMLVSKRNSASASKRSSTSTVLPGTPQTVVFKPPPRLDSTAHLLFRTDPNKSPRSQSPAGESSSPKYTTASEYLSSRDNTRLQEEKDEYTGAVLLGLPATPTLSLFDRRGSIVAETDPFLASLRSSEDLTGATSTQLPTLPLVSTRHVGHGVYLPSFNFEADIEERLNETVVTSPVDTNTLATRNPADAYVLSCDANSITIQHAKKKREWLKAQNRLRKPSPEEKGRRRSMLDASTWIEQSDIERAVAKNPYALSQDVPSVTTPRSVTPESKNNEAKIKELEKALHHIQTNLKVLTNAAKKAGDAATKIAPELKNHPDILALGAVLEGLKPSESDRSQRSRPSHRRTRSVPALRLLSSSHLAKEQTSRYEDAVPGRAPDVDLELDARHIEKLNSLPDIVEGRDSEGLSRSTPSLKAIKRMGLDGDDLAKFMAEKGISMPTTAHMPPRTFSQIMEAKDDNELVKINTPGRPASASSVRPSSATSATPSSFRDDWNNRRLQKQQKEQEKKERLDRKQQEKQQRRQEKRRTVFGLPSAAKSSKADLLEGEKKQKSDGEKLEMLGWM